MGNSISPGNMRVIRAIKPGRLLLVLLVSIWLIPAFPSLSSSFEGPVWNKNQFPLFIHALSPRFEQASMEHDLSIALSYSSVFIARSAAEWSVNADMEMAELTLRYRRVLSERLELGIEVPVLVFTSGFLDGFLNSYHHAFGLDDYGRPSRPDNAFLYEVRRNGAIVVRGKDGAVGLGDLRVSVKAPLLRDDPALSLRAEVELPTGDAEKGYGNESFDLGASVLAEKRLGERVKAYLSLGMGFPGDLKGYETVELRDFVHGGLAIEALPWKRVSLTGQLSFQSSPFPATGIYPVDGTALLLTLGGRYRWDGDSIEVAFTEDLTKAGAPDFTVALVYKRRLPPDRQLHSWKRLPADGPVGR